MPTSEYHIQLTRNRIHREERQYQQIIKGISKSEQARCETYGQQIAQATRNLLYHYPENPETESDYLKAITTLSEYLLQNTSRFTPAARTFLSTYYSNHEYDVCDLTANLMDKTYTERKRQMQEAEEERQRLLAELEREDSEEEEEDEDTDIDDLTDLFDDDEDWFFNPEEED